MILVSSFLLTISRGGNTIPETPVADCWRRRAFTAKIRRSAVKLARRAGVFLACVAGLMVYLQSRKCPEFLPTFLLCGAVLRFERELLVPRRIELRLRNERIL